MIYLFLKVLMSKKRKRTQEQEEEVFQDIIDNPTSKTSALEAIKIHIKCKSENQKKLINSIKTKDVTICSGLAGTGKTYLSCAEALYILKNNPKIKKIVIVKSVTTLKEEEMGFLKGSLAEKMEPVMYSFTGNFEKLIGKDLYNSLKIEGLIEEKPIAYVRGITIDNAIVVIDECQNITVDNMRTLLTRIGEDSKYILLGDERQIDMKDKRKSSLKIVMDKFEKYPEFGIIRLGKEDVVRHRLINLIEDVFNEIDEETREIKPTVLKG
jgi:phosphate starvation-inducible PhoH-like protein